MKILLTTLNSKYVHSNLALKYLYTVVADEYSDVDIREFTINKDKNYIYNELMRANYDMVCFSCYIWNIDEIKTLAADLKISKPNLRITLGGPEVSYNGHEFMRENPWADFILAGEGEYNFYRFMQVLHEPGRPFETVPGLIYRQDDKIYVNSNVEPVDFNVVPFPYTILDVEKDRVVYYESSRGCPFRCSYCLSSIDKTVKALSLKRVKSELTYFLFKEVPQVKFIDRTFNYDRERAFEIFQYIMDNDNGKTSFHFEICADLLDNRTIELLSTARKGLFELEIGIQSTHPPTLKAVNRKENVYPTLYNTMRLVEAGNMHIHVDLIAGLPLETYELFERSFNKVYRIKADALQLGFLKVLKGTSMERNALKYGIKYRNYAPYEVIMTDFISAEELVKLHDIEEMVDVYYNRGGFMRTLDRLVHETALRLELKKDDDAAFRFYEDLAEFYFEKGFQNKSRSKDDQYRILHEYIRDREFDVLGELDEDARGFMDELNYKRFVKKGWEIN